MTDEISELHYKLSSFVEGFSESWSGFKIRLNSWSENLPPPRLSSEDYSAGEFGIVHKF
jgi:hypothetical protein